MIIFGLILLFIYVILCSSCWFFFGVVNIVYLWKINSEDKAIICCCCNRKPNKTNNLLYCVMKWLSFEWKQIVVRFSVENVKRRSINPLYFGLFAQINRSNYNFRTTTTTNLPTFAYQHEKHAKCIKIMWNSCEKSVKI